MLAGLGVRSPTCTPSFALGKLLHWGQVSFLGVRVLPGIIAHL